MKSSAVPKSENYNQAFTEVGSMLDEAVNDGVFPGAALSVSRRGREIYRRVTGFKTAEDKEGTPRSPTTAETVFDLASLTSVIVTTTIMMKLFETGKYKLEERVCRYVQGFSTHGKSAITIAHLLSHCAGLPAWSPFYEQLLKENDSARMGILTSRGARDFVLSQIVRSELEYQPGTKRVYSDVGLILIGNLIEMLTGASLERAAQQLVFQPLQLRSTSFVDLSMIKRRGIHPVRDVIAPTEYCEWRKRVLWGEVHDDNAWAMGGIAGHSGLFSNLLDVQRFSDEILRAYAGESNFLSRAVVHAFLNGVEVEPGNFWRFGWESPNKDNGMTDSATAVGCSGFTGCSLWLEPQEGLSIALLSNRVHPTRNNKKIRTFRPELHAAILKAAGLAL